MMMNQRGNNKWGNIAYQSLTVGCRSAGPQGEAGHSFEESSNCSVMVPDSEMCIMEANRLFKTLIFNQERGMCFEIFLCQNQKEQSHLLLLQGFLHQDISLFGGRARPAG